MCSCTETICEVIIDISTVRLNLVMKNVMFPLNFQHVMAEYNRLVNILAANAAFSIFGKQNTPRGAPAVGSGRKRSVVQGSEELQCKHLVGF